MSYMTPSEQEAALIEALDSLMDANDEVLASIAEQCQLALDDGGPDVMRDCLSAIVARLIDIASLDEAAGSRPRAILSPERLARLRAGKA